MSLEKLMHELELLMEKGFWAEAIELVSNFPSLAETRNSDYGPYGVIRIAVCYDGASDLIRTLLNFGADPNCQSNDGSTALGNAIRSGHRHGLDNFENIKLLVCAGADLRMFDETGNPPLHEAVREGRRDVVELLLEAGADPHQKTLYGDDVWQWMDYLKDWRMKDLFPSKDGASEN